MSNYTHQDAEAEIAQLKKTILDLRDKPYYIHGFTGLLHRFFQVHFSVGPTWNADKQSTRDRWSQVGRILEKESFERHKKFQETLVEQTDKKLFIEKEIARIDTRFSHRHGCYFGETDHVRLYLFNVVQFFDPALQNLASEDFDGTGLGETAAFELFSDLDHRLRLSRQMLTMGDAQKDFENSQKLQKYAPNNWKNLFDQAELLAIFDQFLLENARILTEKGCFIDIKGNKAKFWAAAQIAVEKGWLMPFERRTMAALAGQYYQTSFDPSFRGKAKNSPAYQEFLDEAKSAFSQIPRLVEKVGDNGDNEP